MIRTFMLMAAMTALFVGLGGMLGGEAGLLIAFMIAGVMNFSAYWNSDKAVLRMYGAKPVTQAEAPGLVAMVQQLSARADLPMPKVYIINQDQPNAFATGRNPENAAVAATTGLLRQLNREEIEGVMAHELAHIKNRDTLTMTITATLAGAISMLANFAMFFGNSRSNPLGLVGTILVMILAPIAAALVQMAISRTREYAADKTGAAISGNPEALASALERISARPVRNNQAEENPATAHLFIANPLSRRALQGLFSTHPPMRERVRRLRAMQGGTHAHQAHLQTEDRFQKHRTDPARYNASVSRKPKSENVTGSSGIPQTGDTAGQKDKPQKPKGPWG